MIAKIEQFVKRQTLLAHRIHAHVNLQPLAALLQRRKSRLAHDANRHDAPCDRHGRALGLQRLRAVASPHLRANLRNGVRGRELVGIRSLSELLDLCAALPCATQKDCAQIPNQTLYFLRLANQWS